MKFFRRYRLIKYFFILSLAGAAVVAVRAELPSWAQETIASTPLEAALFRLMVLSGGPVTHIRPPGESRERLTALIGQAPHDAELYSIRAREEERAQSYVAAEADWKRTVDNSQDKVASLNELADFYARRVEPSQELNTLLQLGALPERSDERFQSASQQAQWISLTKAITVANEAILSGALHQQIFESWIRRYPQEVSPYQAYLDWAIQVQNRRAAEGIATGIKAAFPGNTQLAVTTDAKLARIASGDDAALAVYSKNFSPLWPDALRTEYFQALSNAHQLRAFLGQAQTAAAADPASLDPALRLFFYYEAEGRKDIADQQLLNLLARRGTRSTTWSAAELKMVAALLLRVADYDEAARLWYLLYQLPSASPADKEQGLASVISLLLDVPEQPLRFGNRDLSLYSNIAQMDRHPGFLNGILSLVLNSTEPAFQYQNASQTAVAYFHRASASLLIDKLKQQFPRAPQTGELEAKLYSTYATYGQEDAITRLVPGWLVRNPNAPEYVSTAVILANAYAAKQNTSAELALYDSLLAELANKSGHMPLGAGGVVSEAGVVAEGAPDAPFQRQIMNNMGQRGGVVPARSHNARSPDYARVLDRYVARLVQLNQRVEAVGLLRKEIDRNPDDPGIYQRLALFLEQNHLESDVEQTYRDALNHFKDMSWASKLGRYYVRRKEDDAYQALAHQITDTFKGSQLADFLASARPTSPVLYRQVNLYAHQRFPYDLTFVRNLLQAYRSRATADPAAYEKLLRENWFYDSNLKHSFFEYLSAKGKLRSELAALPNVEQAGKDSNLAALEFRGAAQAWLTNYETAAPAFVRLASLTPGDRDANTRAISIERSLAPSAKGAFNAAIRLAQQDVNAEPGDRTALTRVGEIYADREMYTQARPWWKRVGAIQPGMSDGYLDSATVFWDYFQFSDALRVITDARQKLGSAALFGYEAGAIHENEGDYKQAVRSYIQAALHDGSAPAKSRLLKLARRTSTGPLVEEETARLTASGFDNGGFELRLALLEAQSRRAEIQGMLRAMLPRANRPSELEEISSAANRLGFDEITAQCLQRTVAMSADPVEKLQARIELGRFYENHDNAAAAGREFSSLLNDEPTRLGVIRAAVDFYWREKQLQAAVTTLDAAANRAQPPYQKELRREAAEKATNAGLYQDARRLLDQLLTNDPYNGDLLAEKASTYARQGDHRGLAGFYSAQLKVMQAAKLSAQDKTARVAALRRGYILALTRLGQFSEVLEQYQLVLNAFPEDNSLTSEVALFAESHQLAPRVTAYYVKATADSPHDYRWPLVLAHLQTSLRHYPEAIAAFDKAAYVRPDRSDLFAAKADLETRLLRFDDALKSYGKLYELSFHDVQYLANQADLNARMGKQAEAMQLLRSAYIAPHPNEPGGYVAVMRQVAQWHMFDQVDALFRELRPRLAPNSAWKMEGLTIEIEALVALHRPTDAIGLMDVFGQQPGEINQLSTALGADIERYLTPQEKAAFARQIASPQGLPGKFDLYALASAAGLRDLEATELFTRIENQAPNANWMQLQQLQASRLQYEQLGHQLEAIAKGQTRSPEYEQILGAAFRAYASAGDATSQLRLTDYAGGQFAHLFVEAGGDLNARLAALAQRDSKRANQVVGYLIANEPANRAVPAIAARGRNLTPQWVSSYTALTGLYSLASGASGGEPWALDSFQAVLGPRTVSTQLAGIKQDASLRAANWFYYAARYGDYLGYLKKPDMEDYLPAAVEASPAASNSYIELAGSYEDLNQPARAAELYRYALQLSPQRGDVYDHLALLDLGANRRADAIEQWRHAFEILAARVEQGPLPPDYWPTARAILAHVNRANALNELKPAADNMLRTYARRNGAYQFEPFLAGIFEHPPDRRAALAWVIELASINESSNGMGQIIRDVLNSTEWIQPADKDPLYRAQIEQARKAVDSAAGQAAAQAREELNRQMSSYAQYLFDQKRWPEEWTVLQQVQPASGIAANLLIPAAGLTGHLDELLSRYRANPDAAPASEQVLEAALSLDKIGHHDVALKLEEYEYGRELQGNSQAASAWFGMAAVRFEQKRDEEALALIRNVTVGVGAPFQNLPQAVRLLKKEGLKTQATEYALEWKRAEPWNEEAQLSFAQLKGDAKMLDSIRGAPAAPYSVRVAAARSLRDVALPGNVSSVPGLGAGLGGGAGLGRGLDKPGNVSSVPGLGAGLRDAGLDELALLTHKIISPAEASQPFYVQARLDAASESPDMRQRRTLYQEAIALDPDLREPRLQLAEAAFKSGRDVLGLAAFGSEQILNENSDAIEQLAAEAYARRQQWGRALNLYNDLLKRDYESANRAALTQARDSVRQKQNLNLVDLARRPIVGDTVAQQTVVKPKLKTLPASWVAVETLEPEPELEQR